MATALATIEQPCPKAASRQHSLRSAGKPDRLREKRSSSRPELVHTFAYDPDGRVTSKTWGWNGLTQSFAHGFDSNHTALDTVFKSALINGQAYSYFYDAFGRRRLKQYPAGTKDEFIHDVNNQLLADQGNQATSNPAYHVIDDYVWLDGRPVVLVRGRANTGTIWTRASDATTDCARNSEAAACGFYFPATDHIGKPVVMLDSARRVTGTGEYDAFGNFNRVVHHAASPNPYPVNQTTTITSFRQARQSSSEVLQIRADFHGTELFSNVWCVDQDRVNLYDKDTSNLLATIIGWGRQYSQWMTPTNGGIDVKLVSGCRKVGNPILGISCHCATTANTLGGALLEAYEYRRRQTGTSAWFFTPLRFPGQYHDAETNLFENWNRYYDPSIGRYLQPEPMMQEPEFIRGRASVGTSTNAYAYASNNPLAFVDPNGLHDTAGCMFGGSCGQCMTQANSVTDSKLKACVKSKCYGKDTKLDCSPERKKESCFEFTDKHGKKRRRIGEAGEGDSEIGWCEEPMNEDCQAKLLVHELAHTCGWDHEPGKGVPSSKEIQQCMPKKK